MKAVYKYELLPGSELLIQIPALSESEKARILHVDAIDERLYVWALCDPTLVTLPHRFYVVPTGMTFDTYPFRYVGTALMRGKSLTLVWHVWERIL